MVVEIDLEGCMAVNGKNDRFKICTGVNKYGDKMVIGICSLKGKEKFFDKVSESIKYLRKEGINRREIFTQIYPKLMKDFKSFKRKKAGFKFKDFAVEKESEV